MVLRGSAGWQVDITVNFCPNVMIFLLTLRERLWYIVGAYVPPKDVPAVHRMAQAIKAVPKGLEIILTGDLNLRLRDLCDKHEDDLTTVLADRGLFSMINHIMPQRRYSGEES